MQPSPPAAGVYIHWPFCERKCPYCDFYTFGREHPHVALADAYLARLLREIESAPARFALETKPCVDTVYFGGGTPSLMGAAALEQILETLRATFDLAPDSELTLEVNPTTAETAGLPGYLALGVNRLSVGAQSFDDAMLRELGRVHDAATTRRAIELIQALGVTNFSLDIMFGLSHQTLAQFQHDLATVIGFAPAHISAYNLTIHAGTPYARRERERKIELPDEETQLAMFEHLIDSTAAAGYMHYEVSNWSRPGLASRHNSKYWRDVDVFAFGASAHGVRAGLRSENPRDLRSYVQDSTYAHATPLDPPASDRARRGEIMMLALRRVEGVAWSEIDAWMRDDARVFYAAELGQARVNGWIEADAATLRLTRAGLLLCDTVSELFY